MAQLPALSLPEWVALAVIDETPTHGFAIAGLTAANGPLGAVWQIPRPVVYRALGRLEEAELIEATAVEAGNGPQRRIYAATRRGRAAVDEWLRTPVEHVRDIRSHLLIKLALLDRRDRDLADLLQRQRRQLEPIVDALGARPVDTGDGFAPVLAAWRRANAEAALSFVAQLTP